MTWALLPLLAAGCGGLLGPDFGTVRGRLEGVTPEQAARGHVYVLGDPELRAKLEADGSFEIIGVRTGEQQLVVYDGDVRADIVNIRVEDERVSETSKHKDELGLAAFVVLAARPAAGAQAVGRDSRIRTRFNVEQAEGDLRTIHEGVEGESKQVALAVVREPIPLPAGTWDLEANLEGFRGNRQTVTLTAGASHQFELDLEVNTDAEGGRKGCEVTDCCNGLKCDERDGRCYACVAHDDCPQGASCEERTLPGGIVERYCAFNGTSVSPGGGQTCNGCEDENDCTSRLCVDSGLRDINSGLPYKYCSFPCPDLVCPADYQCVGAGQFGNVCVLKGTATCQSRQATVGVGCFTDEVCRQSLPEGRCIERDASGLGYCSVECDYDDDDDKCPRSAGFESCRELPGTDDYYCSKKAPDEP